MHTLEILQNDHMRITSQGITFEYRNTCARYLEFAVETLVNVSTRSAKRDARGGDGGGGGGGGGAGRKLLLL